MVKKVIDVIVLVFDDIVSIDVTFFETTPFSLSSTVTSQGEDNDLLVYIASSPAPTLAPAPIKPPYSCILSAPKPSSFLSNIDCFVIRSSLE